MSIFKSVKKKEIKVPLSIIVLPHQHNLFCERKQRVCGASGQTQENEHVKFSCQNEDHMPTTFVWVRVIPKEFSQINPITLFHGIDKYESVTKIPQTENIESYQLTKEDVGSHISVLFSTSNDTQVIISPLGPVTPGPPRLVELAITCDEEAKVGTFIKADCQYIGQFSCSIWLYLSIVLHDTNSCL
jgi:hypothetical protein